jgi:hypothetical protein
MNLRSLRVRLAHLEERFPQGDERALAEARLDSLLWKERINGLHSLTRAEDDEKYVLWCWLRNMPDKTLPEVIECLKKHIAEFNIPRDLSVFEVVDPIAKAEQEDVKEKAYGAQSFPPTAVAEKGKAADELVEQERAKAEQESRLRLQHLKRKQERNEAAETSPRPHASYSPAGDDAVEIATSLDQRRRPPAIKVGIRIANEEDDVDWESIEADCEGIEDT